MMQVKQQTQKKKTCRKDEGERLVQEMKSRFSAIITTNDNTKYIMENDEDAKGDEVSATTKTTTTTFNREKFNLINFFSVTEQLQE